MIDPLPGRRRRWPVVVPLLLFLALAAAWTGLWFRAASTARAELAAWHAREEQLGRNYTCASHTIGGYPFRIEVRCTGAVAEIRNIDTPFVLQANNVLIVAQVYQPTRLIAEIGAPVHFESAQAGISLLADWTLAQTSVRGLPSMPESISLAIDHFRLDRQIPSGTETLVVARHLELHARIDPESSRDRPVLDFAARLTEAALPVAGLPAAQSIDLDLTAVLRGLKDLTPRPAAVLLRQLQAAGGRLEVSSARLQRGDMVAVGAGGLGLSPQGRLDGALRLTIAGFDIGALRGLFPGLTVSKSLNGVGMNLLGLLGQQSELEGRRAVTMPLRFADGAVSLGPLGLGRTAPLY